MIKPFTLRVSIDRTSDDKWLRWVIVVWTFPGHISSPGIGTLVIQELGSHPYIARLEFSQFPGVQPYERLPHLAVIKSHFRAPHELLENHSSMVSWGLWGALNWGPIMPIGLSLSYGEWHTFQPGYIGVYVYTVWFYNGSPAPEPAYQQYRLGDHRGELYVYAIGDELSRTPMPWLGGANSTRQKTHRIINSCSSFANY